MQWSGSILFFIEAYTDLVMFVAIDLKYADSNEKWKTLYPAVQYSQTLSFILLPIIVLASVFIVIHYYKNRESWTKPEFNRKYNSLLEGFIINVESK